MLKVLYMYLPINSWNMYFYASTNAPFVFMLILTIQKNKLIKPIVNFSGVAWGCRWSWDTVGVFKEICYCETNNCNGASSVKMSFASVAIVFVGFLLRRFL